MTMLRVAERVSRSTGAAVVVSPAPLTTSDGCPPQPASVGYRTVKSMKHGLVLGGCGVPQPHSKDALFKLAWVTDTSMNQINNMKCI